jgi:pimeloyl-ACP methyl ester carboxylesterase
MASRKRTRAKRSTKTGARPAAKRGATSKTAKVGKSAATKSQAPARRKTAKAAKTFTRATALVEPSLEDNIEASESGGATTIVYVHGIGNKPPASVLKAQWDQALFEFDLGERSRMAYWVDRERYPVPINDVSLGGDYADGSENAPTGEFSARAVRETWEPAKEIDAVDRSEISELAGEGDGTIATGRDAQRLRSIATRMLGETSLVNEQKYARCADELHGEKGEHVRRIQAQRYGAAALQAKIFNFLPKPMRQWLTRNVTKMFLRDVNDLFVDKAKGARMFDSLRERLRSGNGPFVVVAHSQGTMIAYCVLMDPEFANKDIALFVTVGSPLGIDEVQDYITELTGQRRLAVPPNVRQWINVCDPLDPVALDKDIAAEFAPNAKGVKVENHVKYNPDSPRHPHSGTGYLSLEEVRQPVRHAVNTALFQPVAAFKMAKDVVRALADGAAEERHRILVQLQDFATTEQDRDRSLARIYETLGAGDPGSQARELLQPEELQRYVALSLTRAEAERLASEAHEQQKYPVARIWKNSAKWAYIDQSVHTTQAFPAHRSYFASGNDVTWAVLDSGIHWTHPHFGGEKGSIKCVYDCTSRKQRQVPAKDLQPLAWNDAAAMDMYGHGAHVAGIIAGSHTANDKEGRQREMCGMAPAAKLAIYKVLDNNGSGEDSWIIKALDHIFETNERAGQIVVHGVNLSLGGDFDVESFNCGHTPLCVELRRLWRQGVVVVIAAGNEGWASLNTSDGDTLQANMGMSIGDPANLDEAIVVGSVHKERPHTYGTSFFSSRGPTADGRMKPDCVAPGERILSVRNDVKLDPARQAAKPSTIEQLYTEMSGTSMAAPHVSGLIAAFLSKRREFIGRPDDVKRILLDNCTDLGRQRSMQGAGMPNLVKMLVIF